MHNNPSARPDKFSPAEHRWMHMAINLARRASGQTSPNPIVGAVLVKNGKSIGRGWHRKAGEPHAEIEALRDADKKKHSARGATLFVTLEPCCTHGRTPPCTNAIIAAGIKEVIVGAVDPNPAHEGNGLKLLRRAGIPARAGLLAKQATRLNEPFNQWIVHRTPLVTVKAAMSLDGKIATRSGESKWITGEKARAFGMQLRQRADAILVGVNTILTDNPSLTVRSAKEKGRGAKSNGVFGSTGKQLRRIVLDPRARTPLGAKILSDEFAHLTTIVVTKLAQKKSVDALAKRVHVMVAPSRNGRINLRWLLKKLGAENVTSLLVEGGGETNAAFLLQKLAHRVAFFYAPIVMGGRNAPKGVAGDGLLGVKEKIVLREPQWSRLGPDLLLTALL